MPLSAGRKLGFFEIQSPLGAGGMGEVYRARDSRLDRDVALKVLPEAFACDQERMARFERESKVLASLNHPNIASVYGLEESDGTRGLVMELVEGPTLSERIKKGLLPLEEALPIARQITEGLEYAHERGIIHRDLKPSNIKLTPEGNVKLLDFGLAKALEGETPEEESQNSPTLSAIATRAGVLLGTAAYMSPEQARGKRADRRADIWAFGVVLYEMLTGKPLFAGETTSDTLAGVIRAEPEWSALPGAVSPRIRELLRRCLLKDPKQRLQAIGEARIAIEETLGGKAEKADAEAQAATVSGGWRRSPWAAAALIAVLAAGALAGYWLRKPSESHAVMRMSLSLPGPLANVFTANPGSPVALSPDGSQLVYVGSTPGKPWRLYLRRLDQQTATPIPNSENAVQPFFSPDGQWIGFVADGNLRKMSLHGGPTTLLAEAPVPHGASWFGDSIIYSPNFGSGLMRISASGGKPQVLTTPNLQEQEVSHRWPQVLPGGKAVLFTIQMSNQSSYNDAKIAVLSLETGKWHELAEGGFCARYVPSGHVIYARAGTLMAAPFDLARMEVTGTPVPVQEGVVTAETTSGSAEYAVTDFGLLAYVPGSSRPPDRSLVWVDRHGTAKELPAPSNFYSTPRISPDGKLLAVQIISNSLPDIWIYEFARNTLTRLTFGPGPSAVPLWTPDGRRVLFRGLSGYASFRWKPSDGSGKEEVLLDNYKEDPGAVPSSISPDGKTLLFGSPRGNHILSLDGSGKIQPFLQASASNQNLGTAQFSPDGRWVAYMSSESGRAEVYVQPYPGPGGKWMISSQGGGYPRWARNGREIFFLNGDKMVSVAVETQPTFKAGTPQLLFQGGGYLGLANWDVSLDGQHFLMVKDKEAPASPQELNLILNWAEELKRLAPPGQK